MGHKAGAGIKCASLQFPTLMRSRPLLAALLLVLLAAGLPAGSAQSADAPASGIALEGTGRLAPNVAAEQWAPAEGGPLSGGQGTASADPLTEAPPMEARKEAPPAPGDPPPPDYANDYDYAPPAPNRSGGDYTPADPPPSPPSKSNGGKDPPSNSKDPSPPPPDKNAKPQPSPPPDKNQGGKEDPKNQNKGKSPGKEGSPGDPPPPAVVVVNPSVPSADNQTEALLAIKAGFSNADEVPQLQSWVPGTNPCDASWAGVECDNGDIISLLLPNTKPPLTGVLSSKLTDPALATLKTIDLSGNKLGGSLPNAFDDEGVLPELQVLRLSDNEIRGSLGFGANGFKSLRQFYINNNNFVTPIPAWEFSDLQELALHKNYFNESAPSYLSKMVRSRGAIVLLPQTGVRTVCSTDGSLPALVVARGIVLEQQGMGSVKSQLTSLPVCGTPFSPPAASPPPGTPEQPQMVAPPPTTIYVLPPPPPPPGKRGLSTAALVGIGVGAALALALLGAALYCCCRRKGQTAKGVDDTYMDGMETGYYSSTGQWKADSPGGAKVAAAAGAAALMRQPSSVSAVSSGPRSPSFDPLLDWLTSKQEAEESLGSQATSAHSRPTSRSTVSTSGGLPMDVQLWTLNFRDLKIEKQIGEGSFGRVYLAKWHETPVAVKVLLGIGVDIEDEEDAERATAMSSSVLDGLAKESSMMAALRHPNVVGFLGVCMQPPCIVTDYCARGSLCDVLRGAKASSAKAGLLVWERRLSMALDAAKGMLYLHAHQPPIIHRDLKSPNLLVDKHWRCKVSDFNLSKLMEEGSVMSSMAATNPRWLAPEILTGNNAAFASDVYSFAVVLWELLTWELPWGPTNPWQVVTVVTEGGRLEVPPRAQLPGPDTATFEGLDGYVSLMQRCWAHHVADRPTFQEIIAELRELLSQQVARSGRGPVSPSDPIKAHPVPGIGQDSSLGGASGMLSGTTPPTSARTGLSSSRHPSLEAVHEPPGGEEEEAAGTAGVAASLAPPKGMQPGESLEGSASLGSALEAAYASTAAQTGSVLKPEESNSGWGSRSRSGPLRR